MNDITRLLAEWSYDPGQTIRLVFADDGRSVLQVRLPLGLEQYELEGRPDGDCPFGTPTVLDEFERRLSEWVGQHGQDAKFEISHNDFVQLQNEGLLFYYRYILLFQMNDFERVVRDTDHNLRICGLVEKYVKQEDRNSLLQFKPYIMRVNSVSHALMLLQQGRKAEAEAIVQAAIERIRDLPELDSPTFQFERIRSINYLRSALKQVAEKNQADPALELQRELQEALDVENYERAAVLRDRLRSLSILDKP